MANHHVVEDVFKTWISFVVCGPSSVYDFKLAILNQRLHSLLLLGSLSVVPWFEEAHLSIAKPALWVFWQFFNNTIKNTFDTCVLVADVSA